MAENTVKEVCKTAVFEGTTFEGHIRTTTNREEKICVVEKKGEPPTETDKRLEEEARRMAKKGLGGMWQPRFVRFRATVQETSKIKAPSALPTEQPRPKDALERRYNGFGRDRM